jgi:hypothetical protein
MAMGGGGVVAGGTAQSGAMWALIWARRASSWARKFSVRANAGGAPPRLTAVVDLGQVGQDLAVLGRLACAATLLSGVASR